MTSRTEVLEIRLLSTASFLILAVSLCLVEDAQAGIFTVYNRFGAGDTWNNSFAKDILSPPGNIDRDAANGFVVPVTHSGITLNTVEVAFINPFNNDGDSSIVLTLHDDIAGDPGSVLETFSLTLDPKLSAGIYLLNSMTNPTLIPGAQYWLVASATGSASELGWFWNGMDPYFTPNGPSLDRTNLGSWVDASATGQQAFRITANGTLIPEPTTLALATLGLCLAVSYHRRTYMSR